MNISQRHFVLDPVELWMTGDNAVPGERGLAALHGCSSRVIFGRLN